VTGEELDKTVQRELQYLDERNRPWVAKHLVMAARYIDVDPALALSHAQAASRRGGRVGLVREAVGLTAYAAGDFHEALRELRTFRRISGVDDHLAVMADCERALGRPEKAMETVTSPEAEALTGAAAVEVAIVKAGLFLDAEDADAAVKALEIKGLDRNRAFSFSPRLFEAYADALEAAGRDEESADWRSRIAVAERALGLDLGEEPEIVDLGASDEDDAEGVDLQGQGEADLPAASVAAGFGAAEEQGLQADEDGVRTLAPAGEDEDGDLLPEGFEDPLNDTYGEDEASEADEDALTGGDHGDEDSTDEGFSPDVLDAGDERK
jgi:hypothetical protein